MTPYGNLPPPAPREQIKNERYNDRTRPMHPEVQGNLRRHYLMGLRLEETDTDRKTDTYF